MTATREHRVQRDLVTGAVLVGGQSRRMGRDKASLLVDGVPLASYPAAVLADVATEVMLVGGRVAGVRGRVVADPVGGAGPLSGVVAAARAARTPLLLVVACDMPRIAPALLHLLLRSLQSQLWRAAVACRSDAGFEPFPLAVRVAAADSLGAMLDRGVRAMHEAIAELDPLVIAPEEWRTVDPSGDSFVNWNIPADIRQGLSTPPTIRADD